MKQLSLLLALAGLALSLGLVVWFDAGAVLATVLSVGWGGAGLLVAWQALTFILLGLAWAMVLPGGGALRMIWGRMVRDAATTCLPFSPVGGYVIGARALTLQGVAWPLAAAGTVVDVTAEIVAQLLFALFGLSVLLILQPGAALIAPLALGLGVVVAGLALLVMFRARLGTGLRALGRRLLGEWFAAQAGTDRLQAELLRLYGNRARFAAALALHLAGWFVTGVGTWISLRLLGWHGDILPILALEALLDALIAAAFVVPAAAGVQEAGYVGVGAVFGVPPDVALGVSLLRRGRDLAIGVPVLAAWQWLELRRIRAEAA